MVHLNSIEMHKSTKREIERVFCLIDDWKQRNDDWFKHYKLCS